MTIETTDSAVTYTGNGVATAFPYTFLIPTEEEVIVSVFDTVTGITSVLDAADYSISGIGQVAGGVVNYPLVGSPLPATKNIAIQRNVDYTQVTSISNQGGFHPDVLETQLDRIVMQIQQLKEGLDRSVKVGVAGGVTDLDELLTNLEVLAALEFDIQAIADAIDSAASGITVSPAVESATNVQDALEALSMLVNAVGTSQLAAAVTARLTPTGAFMWFFGTAAPTGWLAADGAEVSRTTYADLWAFAGTSGNLAASEGAKAAGQFGPGNGTTTFTLPDLVTDGEFIRAKAPLRTMGSFEADEVKLHGHPFRHSSTSGETSNSQGGLMTRNSSMTNYPAFTGTPTAINGEQIGGTGGGETRPRNVALLPCVKT